MVSVKEVMNRVTTNNTHTQKVYTLENTFRIFLQVLSCIMQLVSVFTDSVEAHCCSLNATTQFCTS